MDIKKNLQKRIERLHKIMDYYEDIDQEKVERAQDLCYRLEDEMETLPEDREYMDAYEDHKYEVAKEDK